MIEATRPAVELPADRSGAVITPNLTVTALSRRLGTVGGAPDTLKQGTFDPFEYFGDLGKILGGINLADIIATAPTASPRVSPHRRRRCGSRRPTCPTASRRSSGGPRSEEGRTPRTSSNPKAGTFTLEARLIQDHSTPPTSTFSVDVTPATCTS